MESRMKDDLNPDELLKLWEDEVGYIKIPLSGKHGSAKYVIVDGDYDGEYFSTMKWYMNPQGYVQTPDYYRSTPTKYMYLHNLVLPPIKGLRVSFLNGNKLDNRSVNLTHRSYSEIAFVRKKPLIPGRKPGTSGYRGVIKDSSSKNWQVRFRGKFYGNHSSKEEAAHAYDRIASQHLGSKAILNFPKN